MSWSAFAAREIANIYFAASPNALVKIGITRRPHSRLLDLQRWSPVPLDLVAIVRGTAADENYIHQIYREEWHHLEWFSLSPELQYLIDCCQSAAALPDFARAPAGWVRRNLPHQHMGNRKSPREASCAAR